MRKALNKFIETWCSENESDGFTAGFTAGCHSCAEELRAALPAIEVERKELVEACRDALFALENPRKVGVATRIKEQLQDVLARVKETQP